MENANLLLTIGNSMYQKSKNYIFFAPFGIAILLIILFFAREYAIEYIVLAGPYTLVNLFVFFMYVMIAIGSCAVWPFFMGLILLGIGQIAMNTSGVPSPKVKATHIAEPLASTPSSVSSATMIRTEASVSRCRPQPSVTKVGTWICGNCQTENSMNYGQCKKCGQFRS